MKADWVLYPRVTVAILAKQKEVSLPPYLAAIEALDYPKSRISLYVRTNNNTDATADILQDWLNRVGNEYEHVSYDGRNVPEQVERFATHEWNGERFKVLGAIRQKSMAHALARHSDYYFVCDVDNYIKPNTLKSLVGVGLTIVSPLLLHGTYPSSLYSNYHAAIDANGYYADTPLYMELLERRVCGLVQVPVVHCTYLIQSEVIPKLSYDDDSYRYEYVVFSDSARKAGVPQYLDTREVYGYLTMDESPESIAQTATRAKGLT